MRPLAVVCVNRVRCDDGARGSDCPPDVWGVRWGRRTGFGDGQPPLVVKVVLAGHDLLEQLRVGLGVEGRIPTESAPRIEVYIIFTLALHILPSVWVIYRTCRTVCTG